MVIGVIGIGGIGIIGIIRGILRWVLSGSGVIVVIGIGGIGIIGIIGGMLWSGCGGGDYADGGVIPVEAEPVEC